MKQNKILQSGRSMVETIGVLAVMGVLTIGGIAGYNYGINKHRANQVLQDISLIYQETKYPNSVRQIVDTGSFPDMEVDTQSSYEYSFTFPDLKDFIYDSSTETLPNLISVNVSGVPKTACDILLKNKPSYVLMLKANGESVWTCDQEVNELNYIFEITADKLEYGKCTVCTGEHCFDDDLNCPEGEYCYNDTCSKCAAEYILLSTGQCIKCNELIYNHNSTKEDCYRCDNTLWGYALHSGGNNKCFTCASGWKIKTTPEFCQERCGQVDGVVHAAGYCFSAKNFGYLDDVSKEECEKIMEYNDNTVIFYPKDANGTSNTGMCTNCANRGTDSRKNTTGTACECGTGQFWTFHDDNHSFCRECTYELEQKSSKTECDKCPNRYYNVAKGGNDRAGWCPLCPSGQVKDTSAEGDGRRCVDAPAE